jgi:hypothetical protein
MGSRSLDDLTIEELAALPKWAIPPRLQTKLEEAMAAENRNRVKKADEEAGLKKTFRDARDHWSVRTEVTVGSQDTLSTQSRRGANVSQVGPRGGRYRIRFNSAGQPYRQYFR